jgi:hypothetical protein
LKDKFGLGKTGVIEYLLLMAGTTGMDRISMFSERILDCYHQTSTMDAREQTGWNKDFGCYKWIVASVSVLHKCPRGAPVMRRRRLKRRLTRKLINISPLLGHSRPITFLHVLCW